MTTTTHRKSLEQELDQHQVMVVDPSMEFRAIVSWPRAVTLIVTNEAYTLLERGPEHVVRSQKLTIRKPLVVVLNKLPPRYTTVVDVNADAPKKKILRRDNWTCQYCGNYGDTIDHIMPKSRGGKNTWSNLCCACSKCNGAKRNRTPAEAGLRQPVIPSEFGSTREQRLQDVLYEELASLIG
jgi:5-methylcytosine-specific restriction endonuclease McrA